MRLSGIFAPLTTPFTAGGELDLDRWSSNVVRYGATGLAGFLILGSSGEAVYLSREEKLEIFRLAAQAAPKGKILLAGTGEESLRASLEMTERAAELGYHAAVVRTPHYFKPSMTQPALLRFYTELADRSPIPVLPYTIPPLTGIDLGLETILALARHPNIAGLKESSGNLDKLAQLMAGLEGSRFAVLVGGPSTLYPSLCLGAQGAILALASAMPGPCLAIAQAFAEGDHAAALRLQRAILPGCRMLAKYGVPGLKAAADAAGYYGGPPRLPQLPLSAAETAEFAAVHEAVQAVVHDAVHGAAVYAGGGEPNPVA